MLQVVGPFCGKRSSQVHTAQLVDVSTWTIQKWAYEFEMATFLVGSKRGKHSKTSSPISDESFRAEFRDHVKENSRKKGIVLDICLNTCFFVKRTTELK